MKWTKEQADWFIENYPSKGVKATSLFLGMAPKQIRSKVKNLKRRGIHLKYIGDEFVRVCTKCDQEKSLDEFYNDPKGVRGKHSSCIQCWNEKERSRYLTDDTFKLKRTLRSRFKRFMKGNFSENFESIIGGTLEVTLDHLQCQGISSQEYHIDHIVPLGPFQDQPEILLKLFHYKNCQILPKKENLRKQDSLLIAREHLARKLKENPNDEYYLELWDILTTVCPPDTIYFSS